MPTAPAHRYPEAAAATAATYAAFSHADPARALVGAHNSLGTLAVAVNNVRRSLVSRGGDWIADCDDLAAAERACLNAQAAVDAIKRRRSVRLAAEAQDERVAA
jgi:hypothetical protein